LEHLKLANTECGFKYVRMHGIFNDDMFVYRLNPDGSEVYNWQYVDEVYDRMLSLGVRPFVEMSFFPSAIAAPNSKTCMWYKGAVTVDRNNFGRWHNLISNFVQHLVERYGLAEVEKWYFEVWNEPNLTFVFFDGGRDDYFRMYKEAATAIKAVSPTLKVGGPATSNFVADNRYEGQRYDNNKSVFYSQDKINQQQWEAPWIVDFLKFCEKENLPVDFISSHPYPTDYALDPDTGRGKDAVRYVNSLHDDVTWLRKQIANSRYKDAELHLTEWSTSPNSRDCTHDLLPPAAYIIKASLDCEGLANSLMYWTFTDVFEEKGGGNEMFHGGFGMINYQGIVKPSFHAFRMLHKLGDEMLYYKDPIIVSRSSNTGKITALAFNYPDEYFNAVPSKAISETYMNGSSKEIDLVLDNLTPNATFCIEILDKDHGNIIDVYKNLGRPRSTTAEQEAWLRAKAWETDKQMIQADANGHLEYKTTLTPWACVLINQL
jgi:xylan 1,4-beta-xylosidase